ncbi:MAG: T9SS type A sorting domain-containing protein [Crocinitomicaceae bacterium]|nr:T9SS type A sorting domain-containing protein [Crocinitomicaceae bacterium]
MKSILLTFITFLAFTSIAQEIHKCYTHEVMQKQEELTPGYLQSVNEAFYRAKNEMSHDRSTVYTIPVVVHIVYNNAQENLADSVIFDQIERLNEDYRRLNADTVNMRDTFQTIVGDSFIQFELATTDPNGNPTTGITRTSTTHGSFFNFSSFNAEDVKSSSSGGIDPWNQQDYLNIWVCDMSVLGSPFILGYATPPNNLPHWPPGSADNMSDGVVIQYQAFGSNNPNVVDPGTGPIDFQGRTTAHEVGHYLGLRHIWGDGDCTAEDGIDDTPNADAQSDQDCDTTKNTCTDNIGTLGDLPDMVENYMDYSAETCQNSFTLGQVDMMRSILENYRYELINGTPAPASINEIAFEFQMYPNPSNGSVVINGIPEGRNVITVYGETGQQVWNTSTVNNQIQIDHLNKGVYFIQVINDLGTVTKKLVVL